MYIFTPRTSAHPTNVAGALGASSDADVKPSPLTRTRTRSLSSRARSARAIAYTYAALKTPKAPNAARPRAESLAMTAVDAARARLSEPNLRCAKRRATGRDAGKFPRPLTRSRGSVPEFPRYIL
jgi:hypothetical protein